MMLRDSSEPGHDVVEASCGPVAVAVENERVDLVAEERHLGA